ncbi:MAG: nucleoside phosphorylase [Mucinivorans sp.]
MITDSELIINPNGSVFHLHLCPGQLAPTVILVGDPSRSDAIAKKMDTVELSVANREFVSHTGIKNGQRITVVSTGIGCDNIDIVLTELDALVNVDFATREVKTYKTSLRIIRLGTSGALQRNIHIGHYIASAYSIGIDGLLNFYNSSSVRDHDFEEAFMEQTSWSKTKARPYIVKDDTELLQLFSDFAQCGITISAGGFYGPQGRVVRLPLSEVNYLEMIERFNYRGLSITNFEMEGAAIAGLAALLGHRALTICAIIAQRVKGQSEPDYHSIVEKLIDVALDKLTK